jgi:hypothetical protein
MKKIKGDWVLGHIEAMREYAHTGNYNAVLNAADKSSWEMFGTSHRWCDINDFLNGVFCINPNVTNKEILNMLLILGIKIEGGAR